MPTFTSDNSLIAKDYPFAYVEPPRKYELLTEPEIIAELNKYTINDVPRLNGLTRLEAISFQPSPSETYPNEDRLHISEVNIPHHPHISKGNLYVILDGHAGPKCVEYAIEHLPRIAHDAIEAISADEWAMPHSSSDAICKALARAIQTCDDQLREGFMGALPPLDQLEKMSDDEIQDLMRDEHRVQTMLRYHQGSTALIVLQVGKEIWTAGIGDCVAAVGTKDKDDGSWITHVVSGPAHNIRTNPDEKARLLREHPGEEEHVVAKNRVLALIAVSRGQSSGAYFVGCGADRSALGDGVFKMPRPYLRVFFALPSRIMGKLLVLNDIYHSPPYMTAIADTGYFSVPSDTQSFLLVTTDGLENPEYPYGTEKGDVEPDPANPHVQEKAWISAVGNRLNQGHDGNLAVQLVRDLLGDGEAGQHRASAFVGLDHPEDHYQDDTTLLVAVMG